MRLPTHVEASMNKDVLTEDDLPTIEWTVSDDATPEELAAVFVHDNEPFIHPHTLQKAMKTYLRVSEVVGPAFDDLTDSDLCASLHLQLLCTMNPGFPLDQVNITGDDNAAWFYAHYNPAFVFSVQTGLEPQDEWVSMQAWRLSSEILGRLVVPFDNREREARLEHLGRYLADFARQQGTSEDIVADVVPTMMLLRHDWSIGNLYHQLLRLFPSQQPGIAGALRLDRTIKALPGFEGIRTLFDRLA